MGPSPTPMGVSQPSPSPTLPLVTDVPPNVPGKRCGRAREARGLRTSGSIHGPPSPIDSITTLLILALALRQAGAQTTNATCTPDADGKWMLNEAGESPCLVWSKIQSLCLPQTSFINVPPLQDDGYSYNLPTERSSRCQCNSVAYSLMAACAYCQWPDTTLPPEDDWSESCEGYSSDGLGFGQDVQPIPAFAFHPWSGDVFDPAVAKTISTSPSPATYPTTLSRTFGSQTSTPTSTSALGTSTPSAGSTSSPSAAETADAGTNSPSAVSKWAPIAGGAAGGVILLALLFVLWRWYFSRRAGPRSAKKGRVPYPYPALEGGLSRRGSKSFLEMVGSNTSLTAEEKERDALLKRRTAELMNNPSAFKEPRTAPMPPESGVPLGMAMVTVGGGVAKGSTRANEGGYKTTTQRLAERPVSLTQSELGTGNKLGTAGMRPLLPPSKAHLSRTSSALDFSTPLTTSTSDSSVDSGNIHSPLDTTVDENAARGRSTQGPISALPLAHQRQTQTRKMSHPFGNRFSRGGTQSMDFSLPPNSRPASESTLPSIYEPQTGALTYRGSTGSSLSFGASPFPSALANGNMRRGYPGTETLYAKIRAEDEVETIGAALGSGARARDSIWDKDEWDNEIPALPKASK